MISFLFLFFFFLSKIKRHHTQQQKVAGWQGNELLDFQRGTREEGNNVGVGRARTTLRCAQRQALYNSGSLASNTHHRDAPWGLQSHLWSPNLSLLPSHPPPLVIGSYGFLHATSIFHHKIGVQMEGYKQRTKDKLLIMHRFAHSLYTVAPAESIPLNVALW